MEFIKEDVPLLPEVDAELFAKEFEVPLQPQPLSSKPNTARRFLRFVRGSLKNSITRLFNLDRQIKLIWEDIASHTVQA